MGVRPLDLTVVAMAAFWGNMDTVRDSGAIWTRYEILALHGCASFRPDTVAMAAFLGNMGTVLDYGVPWARY